MKRTKLFVLALIILGALAMSTTGCYSSRNMCQAKKVGNHR